METVENTLYLPEMLREIARIIGYSQMERLVGRFGGLRLFIPKRMPEGHPLAHQLGAETARQMSRHFGGETLSIPRGAQIQRQHRNREIVERYDTGTPVRILAQIYQLTERQIYTILSATV